MLPEPSVFGARTHGNLACDARCCVVPMRLDPIRRDAFSIALATGVYAVPFGVLAVATGFSVAQTCVMSLVAFTGASQFTYVSVLAAGGSAGAALPPALLLAGRNGIYALSLGAVLRGGGRLRRALAAHLVIDETTAMAHAQAGHAAGRRAFWTTGLALFACWNTGTLVGALAGDVIADPAALGLDAIFPAVFLALLAPQVRGRRAAGAALLGAAVALALVPVAPAGVPVMAAALACLPFARRRVRA
jgi:4-azaleucine resistance transporter AzlC